MFGSCEHGNAVLFLEKMQKGSHRSAPLWQHRNAKEANFKEECSLKLCYQKEIHSKVKNNPSLAINLETFSICSILQSKGQKKKNNYSALKLLEAYF